MGAYFNEFWPIFMTSVGGMDYILTKLVILWWNINSGSFRAPSRNFGQAVVQALLKRYILTKRLFAKNELSRSRTLNYSSELFLINALAIATTALVLTTPPFERRATKNFLHFYFQAVMVYLFLTKWVFLSMMMMMMGGLQFDIFHA